MRRALLFATTASLFLAGVGTAYGASLSASSLVQLNNANCGKYVFTEPIIGSAKFTRKEMNRLKVTYKAKGLAPSETYDLGFYDGFSCELIQLNGSFITNAKGVGKITSEVAVPEEDVEFFVDAEPVHGAGPLNNDSFTVVLPNP